MVKLPVKGNSVNERLTPHPPQTPKPVQPSDTLDEISKDQSNLSNDETNQLQL